MTTIVRCARAIPDGARECRDFAFAVEDGRIHAVAPYDELLAALPGATTQDYAEDVVVVPGFVNGHSHAYQVLLRGWADDLPFARWRSDAVYAVVPKLTPEQIFETFAFAFREMLAAGITSVAEFFYLNGAGNAHAEAAIEAARATGIRLAFARTWMDAEYAPAAFRETITRCEERTDDLLRRYPDANVCVAPHSLHAASADMIRAAHRFALERGCLMHIHVAEAQYEGAQTLERFGATPVALLHRLGVLDDRTVAVHAIYVSDEERSLLASSGARVVHNPVTNQYLGDGICAVAELRERGVPIALGTDADVKPSLIDEMRAASYLQKLRSLDGSSLGAAAAFDCATAGGGRALGLPVGSLLPGMRADYVVLDATRIDPWSPAVNALVYRGEDSWVRETCVDGRTVYRRGDAPPQLPLALFQQLRSLLALA